MDRSQYSTTFKYLWSNAPDDTINYIPEPWWGNDGTEKDLHSVVINNNPFTGNVNVQSYDTVAIPGLFGNRSYAEFVAKEVHEYVNNRVSNLQDTNKWHWGKRAKPIYDALIAIGAITTAMPDKKYLSHHLSIEMIPWHTPDSNKPQYREYVLANLKPIYDGVFCFAAERSSKIVNRKLKNKVIIRSTYNKITPILNALAAIGKTTERGVSVNYPAGTQGYYFKFRFDDPILNGIEFICIWGTTSRNDFPQPYDPVFHRIICAI
jgi:hypothetical protein